jgi:hypothetical protein
MLFAGIEEFGAPRPRRKSVSHIEEVNLTIRIEYFARFQDWSPFLQRLVAFLSRTGRLFSRSWSLSFQDLVAILSRS